MLVGIPQHRPHKASSVNNAVDKEVIEYVLTQLFPETRVSARNVWEGGPRGGGSVGPPPGEKKSEFSILKVLKMAYFDWNDSKI